MTREQVEAEYRAAMVNAQDNADSNNCALSYADARRQYLEEVRRAEDTRAQRLAELERAA